MKCAQEDDFDRKMNREIVDQIVDAVLYEGYILYPYRASSRKNRQRFTFGRIYPKAYSVAQQGRESCLMQTQCLLRDESKDAQVHVEIRFLHPISREVMQEGELLPELRANGQLYQSWQEAVERQIALPVFGLRDARAQTHQFLFPFARTEEAIAKSEAKLVRTQQELRGSIEIAMEQTAADVVRLTVRIHNLSNVPPEELDDPHRIVLRTFASAHTLIWSEGGECLSLLDPPGQYAEAAKGCRNIGCWPVLIGDETKGERDAMLSSPIILYDYPKIAPESAGNLYDGLEIDEILTLRVQTMTDAEKEEMRQVDDHARRILERTELMPEDHLLQMHGAMREKRPAANEELFNPSERRRSVTVNGVELRASDRVRIRPKRRADAFDIVLAGKIAIIEAIEEDMQGEVHLALVLEDDPGRELGMARQPGHRFFYGIDEVEPVERKS